MVFFGILEIYSREFKPEDKWKLNVTRAQLRAKLQKRQDTLVINCLKHIQNSGKWEIEITEKDVIIFIPKFTELLDEWSRRKLGSYSGVTPKILKTDKDKELDIDKDIKKGKFPSKVFKSPAIEEISTYCKERNNTINPQTFIDHYTGNGWMVGKNKMKDWKAVIRTWETREGNNATGNGTFKRQIRTERDANNQAGLDEADLIAREWAAKKASADGNA